MDENEAATRHAGPSDAGLDACRVEGWPKLMGRLPTPEDLVLPTAGDWRTPVGLIRDKNHSHKRIRHDLKLLELRHRRGHDLRRTMISLAQDDGAVKDILKWGTHGRSKSETINEYRSLQWETICREVAKFGMAHKERASLCDLATRIDSSASKWSTFLALAAIRWRRCGQRRSGVLL